MSVDEAGDRRGRADGILAAFAGGLRVWWTMLAISIEERLVYRATSSSAP